MAINLDERYPGRANPKSLSYPQGSFKNRTSPTSKDGTYLEQDWANDWAGFFQRMMVVSGISPNGAVDTAESSQYFDALSKIISDATPDASTTKKGLVELATAAEAQALTDDTRAITPKKLADSGAVFPGDVRTFAGPVANVPDGWLPCNGAAISRTTYARLFNVIGTTYGNGNGSTTFNLPDLRGEFVRGLDNGRGVDAGRVLGSGQLDALQNITGTFQVGFNYRHAIQNTGGAFIETGYTHTNIPSVSSGAQSGHVIATFDASRVARTADETRPRNVAMNYIIKY